MKEQEIKKDHLLPVQMVSTYHYISRAPVRIYQKKGKSYPSGIFSGVCVFIDHASGYVSINHQVAINSEAFKIPLLVWYPFIATP